MTPPAWLTKTVALVIAIALVVLLLAGLFAWHEWSVSRGEKVNARVDQGQAGAVSNASVEAIQTQGNNSDRAAATDATVKDGQDEINAAPSGNSNDAADRAACRMRAYRDTGRCRQLLGTDPARVE
jgi:hypothetical protein